MSFSITLGAVVLLGVVALASRARLAAVPVLIRIRKRGLNPRRRG